MRVVQTWSDKVPERDGVKSVCYDVAFKPDGTQLVAAVGSRVLMYDALDGDLLHSLKGHKDAVYCVAYSRDGKRFASGGADKTVIIWTHKAEGILKYSHNDSIQSLAYNPLTQQLASTTATDFGLWSPEQKSVAKHKVPAKALCCAWTLDGLHLALGLYNGVITIRDGRAGTEVVSIQRAAPVWALAWCPPGKEEMAEQLAVGCWDATLSFYRLNGQQIGKDRALESDPTSLAFTGPNSEFLLIGGTNRKVLMATRDGTILCPVAERDDWVWCAHARSRGTHVAVACQDGSVSVHQLIHSTVHALYQERYAFRESMTDVVVQHLITEQKVRIRCKDYVKKLAVYKDRLAVQLPERVLIYSLAGPPEDTNDMQYRVTARIGAKLECNLLVLTSEHVILCLEKKLQLYNLDGEKEREWVLEAVIRYIKVVGGPPGREGLLVGLKNGAIVQVLVDNPFVTQLIKHRASIRCLDLSAERRKLAVVDESAAVVVYDLATKGVLFEDANANSVAWNGDMEEMLCYSGNGQLSIKTGDFPVTVQKLQGFVVGFQASKVFCLHLQAMQTIDVPQSSSMHNYLTRGDIGAAYKVACLGVTDSDWRALAMGALTGMQWEIAKKALIRIRDVRLLDLLHTKQGAGNAGKFGGGDGGQLFLAELLAYQGKFVEAARAFARAGAPERAVALFTDLRQFELAKQWASELGGASDLSPTSVVANGVPRTDGASNTKVAELIAAQAAWSEEVSDFRAAAEMYLQAGQPETAIAILARHKYTDRLIDVMRGLSASESDRKALAACAAALARAGQKTAAIEANLKLGDFDAAIGLHLEQEQWDEAVGLLARAPERRAQVHGARARAFAAADRFEDARAAYKAAGLPEQSLRMLAQLAENAVTERRFKDAAQFLHAAAAERLEAAHFACERAARARELAAFWAARRAAEAYYAYHAIHHSTDQPFRTVGPDALLHAALFVLSRAKDIPPGVSLVYVLQTVVKQGEALGAFKLASFAAERLQGMRLPSATWQDEVDLAALALRRQPPRDSEHLLSPCARCGAPLPLFSAQFEQCAGCGHAVFRSFVTFEALPLLEFAPEEGVSHSEAVQLLEEEGLFDGAEEPHMRGRQQRHPGDVQTLRLDDDEPPSISGNGIPSGKASLGATAGELMRRQLEGGGVVRADRAMLRAMRRADVLILEWPTDVLPVRYLCMVDPDVPVAICGSCNQLFEEEEWEMALLEHATCPFCREEGDRPPSFPPRPEPEAEARLSGNGVEMENGTTRPGTGKKRPGGSPGRPGTASARPGTGAGRPTSSWGKQAAGLRPGSSAGRAKSVLSSSTNGIQADGIQGWRGSRNSSERLSNGGMEDPVFVGRLSSQSRR